MEKEFISYKQALALKELGFDKPCFFSYNIWNNKKLNDAYYNYVNHNEINDLVSAPLYQQAFSFFRENYNLEVEFFRYHDFGLGYKCVWEIRQYIDSDKPYKENSFIFNLVNGTAKNYHTSQSHSITELIKQAKILKKYL
jgi:hypothetical protein